MFLCCSFEQGYHWSIVVACWSILTSKNIDPFMAWQSQFRKEENAVSQFQKSQVVKLPNECLQKATLTTNIVAIELNNTTSLPYHSYNDSGMSVKFKNSSKIVLFWKYPTQPVPKNITATLRARLKIMMLLFGLPYLPIATKLIYFKFYRYFEFFIGPSFSRGRSSVKNT